MSILKLEQYNSLLL